MSKVSAPKRKEKERIFKSQDLSLGNGLTIKCLFSIVSLIIRSYCHEINGYFIAV